MVTFAEKARAWARRQGSANSLRETVRSRLLDPDPPRVGYGRIDEFPEDVVVELLTDRQLSTEDRKAVASGWNAALSEVQRLLRDPLLEATERQGLQRPFTRVFRVAELTGHPFLREGVRSTLPLVTARGARITPAQLQEVVAAAFVYAPDDADRADWERLLQSRAEVAGFAFRMLLRLDPKSPNTSDYIQWLFQRQFRDGWNLDAWFLTEFAISAAGSDEPVIDALLRIASHEPALWQRIKTVPNPGPCCSTATLCKVEQRLLARQARLGVIRRSQDMDVARNLLHDVIKVLHTSAPTTRPQAIELVSATVRGVRQTLLLKDVEGEVSLLCYGRSDIVSKEIISSANDLALDRLEKATELRSKPLANVKEAYAWLTHNW